MKPDFARLGPRLGARVRDLAERLLDLGGDEVVAAVADGGTLTVEVAGEGIDLTEDDLDIRMDSAAAWAVAEDANLAIAPDTEITEALEQEGWVRELTRGLQDARKEAGLEVQDRIRLRIDAPAEYARTIETAGRQLQRDLLAVDIGLAEVPDGHAIDVLGTEVRASIAKV